LLLCFCVSGFGVIFFGFLFGGVIWIGFLAWAVGVCFFCWVGVVSTPDGVGELILPRACGAGGLALRRPDLRFTGI
jgi:hypothetical protein